MICFKDMTFCQESTCAEFGDGDKKCHRSLTKKVLEDAERWWGKDNGGAPICMFVNTPDCFVETKEKK